MLRAACRHAAWNKCLTHLLALARAHVESVMFERFMDAVNSCPDPDCRKSLKVSCSSAKHV